MILNAEKGINAALLRKIKKKLFRRKYVGKKESGAYRALLPEYRRQCFCHVYGGQARRNEKKVPLGSSLPLGRARLMRAHGRSE